MQTTISSSCYDAIVIKQENRTYRSTPFQVVFSSNLIKQIQKNRTKQKNQPYKLTLFVNDQEVDVPLKIDQSGRVVFQKIYKRKMSMFSDSSDMSDEDLSHKSTSNTFENKTPSKRLQQKLEDYKNEHAPSKFWQFAWLFNHKKQDNPANMFKIEEDEPEQSNLSKIKQQAYEGEEHSKEPMFHLSQCGNLLKKKETKEEILKTFYDHRVEYSQFIKDPPGFINDSNLVVKIDDSLYTWQLGITVLTCRLAYGRQLSKEEIEDIIKNKFTKSRLFSFISGSSNITKLDITGYQAESDAHKAKELKKLKEQEKEKSVIKYRKTPESDIVKKMKLKYGKNIGKFELDVGEGYKEVVTMKIFLWDHSQKIIISDIDGTITKSDILGQILSKWIHTGVTQLFTQIFKRHYKIIYLTARAIGQYQMTSKFLETVEQDGVYLPEGPLMMSPDGYMRSFTRQVIFKTPDYLKTKILASLNEVFPNTKNPIYCGFGNRQTDSTAYLKINIAPDRIFCITDKSIISRESDKEFNSTYKDILTNINDFFPEYFKESEIEDSSDENVEGYQAVEEFEGTKRTKSVDGDFSQVNLDGYELEELNEISDQSKSRKSQHEIAQEDLQSIHQLVNEENTKDKHLVREQLQLQITKDSQSNVNITIKDPIDTITKGLASLAEDRQVDLKQEKGEPDGQEQVNLMDQMSKEEVEELVRKQLKEDNEVGEDEIISNEEESRLSKTMTSKSKSLMKQKQFKNEAAEGEVIK